MSNKICLKTTVVFKMAGEVGYEMSFAVRMESHEEKVCDFVRSDEGTDVNVEGVIYMAIWQVKMLLMAAKTIACLLSEIYILRKRIFLKKFIKCNMLSLRPLLHFWISIK